MSGDGHDHAEKASANALGGAILLNIVITLAEAGVGFHAGSLALRAATATRTFGLLRAEPLVAFVNGLLLLPLADSLRGVPGVLDVHHVHVWSISSRLRATSAHLVIADGPLSEAAGVRRRWTPPCGTSVTAVAARTGSLAPGARAIVDRRNGSRPHEGHLRTHRPIS